MMKENFSNILNTFILNGFVRSFNNETDIEWKPLKQYVTGDVVTHSVVDGFTTISSQYIALNDGKSGTNPPVHTQKGKIASDGNVRWMYVSASVSAGNIPSNLYLTFGKPDAWGDESNPDEPETTIKASVEAINNIIYARKIGKDSISMVIDRNTWESGKVFEDFHIEKDSYTHPHYTTNNQGFLYYCLHNNNDAPSTVEPIGEGNEPINLLDGYIWLYVGKVENITTNRFVTDDYIPVNRSLVINPYLSDHNSGFASLDLTTFPQKGNFDNNDELEYLIREGSDLTAPFVNINDLPADKKVLFTAIRNTAGVIEKVEINKTGKGFSYPVTAVIRKKGETGKNGKIELEIDSVTGEITKATVKDTGVGYSNGAVAIVKGKGKDAALTLTISTQGKIVDVVIDNAGSGYSSSDTEVVVISGQAGKLASVSILPASLSEQNVIKTLGEVDLMISLELSPSNTYFNYDSDFREVCLVANMLNKETREELNSHEAIGAKHKDYDDLSVKLVRMEKNEGLILYRMNTTKISHVEGQTEKYKLVLEG